MVGNVVLCSRPCCPGYIEAIAHPPGIDPLVYCEKVKYEPMVDIFVMFSNPQFSFCIKF